MTKVCSKCKQLLPLEAFGKLATSKSGCRSRCKKCEAEEKREYDQTDKAKAARRAWRQTEAGKASDKMYNDSPAHKAAVRAYQATDRGKEIAKKVKAKMKENGKLQAIIARYHLTDKYKAKIIRDNHKPNSKEIQQRYYLKRRLEAGTKLCDAMKASIYAALKAKKNGRKWESLVGYTLEELMEHVEAQFKPGMTWANYGKWHLDHVIPRVAHCYEDSNDSDFKRCWALENLQPLWASENKVKSAKIVKPFQPKMDLLFKSPHALDKIN
jgi:hypothetical protein